MIILGIDPGTRVTGYGCIETGERKLIVKEAGVIKPDGKDLLQNRIHRIYNSLEAVVDQYQPQVIVLEKLYAHHQFPATAPVIGHVRGVICLLAVQKKIELIEYSVKRVRASVTGNGNATKEQTRDFLSMQLHLDPKTLTLDASDALALAMAYINMNK